MRFLLILLCTILYLPLWSSGLNISNVSFNESTSELSFTVEWEHSWRTDFDNYDGAYIFVKYKPNSSSWQHADIATASITGNLLRTITSDSKGILLRGSNSNTSRSANLTVTFSGLLGNYYDFRVFGMEMVHIPTNVDYYVGDGVSAGRIHDGGDDSMPFLMTHALSQGELICGSSPGSFDCSLSCVNVPADFPKGQEDVYVMKYHVTQQQYVDFLNTLTRTQQDSMTNEDLSGTTVANVFIMSESTTPAFGNGVSCDSDIGNGPITFYCDRNYANPPNSLDDSQNSSMNCLTYKMVLAYLDWAAMRPISYLEYEKMCRGPLYPVALEKSWGSAEFTYSGTVLNYGTAQETLADPFSSPGHVNSTANRVGYSVPSTGGTRPVSQASYYGVIGLGNNNSDLLVGKTGTSLLMNQYGDGLLSTTGKANVSSWSSFTNQDFYQKSPSDSVSRLVYPHTISISYTSFRGARGI